MYDASDRNPFQASALAGFGMERSGRADAEFAIGMLGPKAAIMVPTATALHFGQWLSWPDWLRDGTSLSGTGPLPRMVSLADDLIIIGNIIDNADYFALVERMLFAPQPVMGATGALSLMHAPNLDLALCSLVKAMSSQNPFVVVSTDQIDDEIHVGFQPPWPMGSLFQFTAIAGLALIYRAIETLHCNELKAMTLETQLVRSPAAQPLLSHFKCMVVPSSGIERLRFPRAWGATTNPHHDPMLWAVARSKLATLISETGDPDIVKSVRVFIVDMLANEHRVPRLKQVAAHLGLSTRTIVRLLAKHDKSFHGLVDDERKARALLVIADNSIPLAEAAHRLGFRDMSSFGRSVRQWFGDTPGRLRKAWSSRAAVGS